MTALVLLILGAVWAAVLIPPALRARAQAHPEDSIGSFHHRLNVLSRTGGFGSRPVQGEFGRIPALPPAPRPVRMSAVQKRRRDILVTLVWIMGASLVLGLIPSFRGFLLLHLVADLLFVGYVVLLVRMNKAARERRTARLQAEREANVTPLHERRRPNSAVERLALRRAANT